MERRKFLVGMGALSAGGAAALGTGAFSRIESQRHVSIQVAHDRDAYLGLKTLDTPNSNNFVDYDGDGHIYIDIGDFGEGEEYDYQTGLGVNSDSFTYFDGMFEICNQGKADAMISYELPEEASHPDVGNDWMSPDPDYDDEQVVGFYWIAGPDEDDESLEEGDRVFVEQGQEVPLELGDCVEIGVRTVTKGVSALAEAPLIDGEVVITADASGAGEPQP